VKGKKAAPKKTCGDFGGVTSDGKACPLKVSKKGRCRHHSEERNATTQAIKERVVALLSEGKHFSTAAVLVGIDATTIWRWRRADPDFDAKVKPLMLENDEDRVSLVEETLFERIVAGKAAPAEVIFWLKNRCPQRWKDKVSAELLDDKGNPQKIGLPVLQAVLSRVEEAESAERAAGGH
jgi:hypothetical protein